MFLLYFLSIKCMWEYIFQDDYAHIFISLPNHYESVAAPFYWIFVMLKTIVPLHSAHAYSDFMVL